jgi:hypothetical protein
MRKIWAAGLCVLAGSFGFEASALVGPASEDRAAAPHVVMVLKRSQQGAAFCTGVVIAPDTILTAAHCAAQASDLRIHAPGGARRDLITVTRTAVHPEYRANAPRTRERSIDLALIRTATPLPSGLRPIEIEWSPGVQVGAAYRIAGYGLGREGDERTAGTLRAGTLAARAPLSNILLWAKDPQDRGLGACTGDSGGPIFSSDGSRLVAITVWSTGDGKRSCGALTQGALLGPQRGWIERTLRTWDGR